MRSYFSTILKPALATLLTGLLLSISCASSACSAKCQLNSRERTCHGDTPPSSGRNMGGMKHCAMAKSDIPANTHLTNIASQSFCHGHLCTTQPALAPMVGSDNSPVFATQVTIKAASASAPLPLGRSPSASEHPHLRTLSPLSALSVLRI
jgi:hypothetical protein